MKSSIIHNLLQHFGHFALTMQLLPVLNKSQPSRVISVASLSHEYGAISFDDMDWKKRKYGTGIEAYGQSKLAVRFMSLIYHV